MNYRLYRKGDGSIAHMFRIYPRSVGGGQVAVVEVEYLDVLMEAMGYEPDRLWAHHEDAPAEREDIHSDRTFDQPSTVKRYVSGETQPAAEGDWQLHNDGHEGEETE